MEESKTGTRDQGWGALDRMPCSWMHGGEVHGAELSGCEGLVGGYVEGGRDGGEGVWVGGVDVRALKDEIGETEGVW